MLQIPASIALFFFFNDTATTEIYTLSLHDALPILNFRRWTTSSTRPKRPRVFSSRSEEHTSELQSRRDLVCRLLLEKKKIQAVAHYYQRLIDGASEEGLFRYFLTAVGICILYKDNASISGAEVGCQGYFFFNDTATTEIYTLSLHDALPI